MSDFLHVVVIITTCHSPEKKLVIGREDLISAFIVKGCYSQSPILTFKFRTIAYKLPQPKTLRAHLNVAQALVEGDLERHFCEGASNYAIILKS